MNKSKVTILFLSDNQDAYTRNASEVREALRSGGEYYIDGMVSVPVGHYKERLGEAFSQSQIEEHPDLNGEPKWNGLFFQRSSRTGDLIILDDNIYLIKMIGFEWIAASISISDLQLADNPDQQKSETFFGYPRC